MLKHSESPGTLREIKNIEPQNVSSKMMKRSGQKIEVRNVGSKLMLIVFAFDPQCQAIVLVAPISHLTKNLS